MGWKESKKEWNDCGLAPVHPKRVRYMEQINRPTSKWFGAGHPAVMYLYSGRETNFVDNWIRRRRPIFGFQLNPRTRSDVISRLCFLFQAFATYVTASGACLWPFVFCGPSWPRGHRSENRLPKVDSQAPPDIHRLAQCAPDVRPVCPVCNHKQIPTIGKICVQFDIVGNFLGLK